MKDFIDIADFTSAQLSSLLERAITDKALFRAGRLPATCRGKTLALIFEKQSLRTRVSFETGMHQLGGSAICLTNADIGLGMREPTRDVARVLGRMCDAITARTFAHATVTDLARFSHCPVINALTDYSHPCQAMADVMTALEMFGPVRGLKLTFVGDGNNVARSLAMLCVKLGMDFVLTCPMGYELDREFVSALPTGAGLGSYKVVHDPAEGVIGARIIYTDTWVSMGQEAEKAKRVAAFKDYQVNEALLGRALKDAIVLHCLPAYRDYEITDGVMEKYAASIFGQAENRLHFQRTLLNVLIAEGGIR